MSHVPKLLGALFAFGLAAGIVVYFVLPSIRDGRSPPAPPTESAKPALPEGVVESLRNAGDAEAPAIFRQALEDYPDAAAQAELRARLGRRAAEATARMEREVEDLLRRFRYRSAVALVKRGKKDWAGIPGTKRMDELLDEIRAEQKEQIADRRQEAEELLDAGREEAARETLRTEWELEARYRKELEDHSIWLERKTRGVATPAPARPKPTPGRPADKPEAVRAKPPYPPALPGYPHPDVKRLGEARELLAKARRLYTDRRYQASADALSNVVGYYGDLRFVKRRRHGVEAMNALSRHGAKGLSGLFHAASVERSGKRVKLRYRFKDEAEILDWEELPTVPHDKLGEFKPTRDGVRGTGVMTFVHHGIFENSVKIRCRAKPNRLKSHGLAFCQAGNESRHILWMVTNHFFVEGENYVKKRPGHSILMFGKGVNADVPVDSPDIGFIFRGASITDPQPRAGEEIRLSFSLNGDRMAGDISCKAGSGGRAGSTVGDDGRGIHEVRPALFVLENSVVFREIVIEGRLHASFERRRVSELLDLLSILD